MFQRTDTPEFTPGFLWQIVLLTALILGLVFFADSLFKFERWNTNVETPRLVLFPYAVAGAHTIENGLLAFSGKPAESPNGKNQVRVLVGLLIISVLCPTIFLLRWRRRKLASPTLLEHMPWTISRILYSLFGALILYLSATSIPIAAYGEYARHSLREAQAEQSSRDAIINEITFMAFDLSQYYILPKERGGGNHTYDGYKLPERSAKTLEATYVLMPYDQTASIRAESVRYPSTWIQVKVDSLGRTNSWVYGGKFQ
jgi:hypothetical protein